MWLVLDLVIFTYGCGSDKPTIEPRNKPIHVGIDPRAKPLIRQYVDLAKTHGVKFTRRLTVGFTDIKAESGGGSRVVGICFYGKNFREIDIDNNQWNTHSPISLKNLIFHELTHCLCGRGHDYGDGEAYPSIEIEEILSFLNRWPFYAAKPGRYADGCPLSIMYTHVLSDRCLEEHQKDYFKEMFNRCSPW